MKSKIKWLIVIIVLVAVTGVYSIVDKNNSIYDKKVDNSDFKALELEETDMVSQSFTSSEKKLDGIELKVAATGDTDNIILDYTLEEQSGKLIAEGESSLDKLKNGKFFRFQFDQVTGCKDKGYLFKLQVKQCEEGSTVSVYNVPGAQKNTEFSVNQESVDGTMAMRTITHRFDLETFVVALCFLLYVILFLRWLSKLFK